MADTTLSDLAAVGSFLAGLGALVSAIFAWRSAADAKRTQEFASNGERLRLRHAVELNAKRAELEEELCKEMGAELKLAYSTLFTFTGGLCNSRLELYKNRVDERLGRAEKLETNASSVNLSMDRATTLSIDDYIDRLTRVESYAAQLQNIRVILTAELERIDRQIDQYRAEVIKGPSR